MGPVNQRAVALCMHILAAVAPCKSAVMPPPEEELLARVDIGAFSPKSIIIQEEGSVSQNYSDQATEKENVSQVFVSPQRIRSLKDTTKTGGYFNLEHEYAQRPATDAVPYKINVRTGNVSHSIHCRNHLACPRCLMRVIESVKSLCPEPIIERRVG